MSLQAPEQGCSIDPLKIPGHFRLSVRNTQTTGDAVRLQLLDIFVWSFSALCPLHACYLCQTLFYINWKGVATTQFFKSSFHTGSRFRVFTLTIHQAKKWKLVPDSSPSSTTKTKVAVCGPVVTGMVSRSARPTTRDGMRWQGRSYAGAGAVLSMVSKVIKTFCTKSFVSKESTLDTNELFGTLIF